MFLNLAALRRSAREIMQTRLYRRLSIYSLGPNEARVLYDFGVSTIALAVALVLAGVFGRDPVLRSPASWLLLLLPAVTVGWSAVIGVYSRLRVSSASRKTVAITAAAVLTASTALLADAPAVAALWFATAVGPLTLARIFLALPHGRHRHIAPISINERGPVLVIGGAGYIGSHTVDLLLAQGRPVRVLDRLMYGRGSLAEFEGRKDFELIEGDVTEITKLTFAMRQASAVIHLGGLVGDPACAVDVDFTRHANVVATRMAREVAQSLGVYRFLFASSCSVYGATDKEVNENSNLNPVSLYAQTKIDSEEELLRNVRDDFFVTVLRFATVFGHSRRPRFDLVANLFTAQAMTDGLITVIGPQQWRPFVHVRDLARALVMTLNAKPHVVQTQVFNVGDSRLNGTILQLAETVHAVTSRRRPVEISVRENVEDRRNYAVSFDKIRTVLGFQADTTIDAGVEEMVRHFELGTYGHYRDEIYSNLQMTRKEVDRVLHSEEATRLYAPVGMHLSSTAK